MQEKIKKIFKIFVNAFSRSLALLSLLSVMLNTPKTFKLYPSLEYVTYVVDLVTFLPFFGNFCGHFGNFFLFWSLFYLLCILKLYFAFVSNTNPFIHAETITWNCDIKKVITYRCSVKVRAGPKHAEISALRFVRISDVCFDQGMGAPRAVRWSK